MEGDNASKSTIPTHKTEEEDEKQQPAACEYGGWHGDDGQECIMEDVVEQPHSDSLGGHIAWQDSCDKPISYLFLDPISKDVEKRSQKVAGGLTEKDLQLLRITTPGNTEIQCFIAARRVLPFPVRDDPPTFQAEHRRERDRLHRELAKMEDAIEARGSEPTTEEAAKTTRLRRRMDTLASGKAEESPKSSVDPELHSHLSSSISSTSQPSSTSKTHSSIQSSATTNTQSNTEANSSLDAPSGKVHNDQKKWPFSLLQKFWK